MVRGARTGSSSRRSSHARGLFAASAFGSSSVPPPVAAGSGEFTLPYPRVPIIAFGPSSVPPPVAASSGQSTPSPPTVPEQSSIHTSFGRGAVSISMDDHHLIKF
ncbi:hypothetical protein Taro_043683 [Colocasia esculenta]|uniref:Uncharacterized protein n=1 Tax=Colocasia esculenta TaxID=4460 RepID=A0A843X160_COLES|nr:hypothetical protein [Colocasia esculenta]